MVERCPDKTEALGPIPSTRTWRFSHFLFMINKDIEKPWWRDGVIVFSKVSAYIAFPIILASLIGKSLDRKYNSEPFGFLSLIAIAFITTIYLIWKEMKNYQKKINLCFRVKY